MKTIANVYLLPSDKESRLHITPEGLLYQSFEPFIQDCKDYKSFHLYITLPQFDLEISKPKEGDYVIWKNQIFKVDSNKAFSRTNNITLAYCLAYGLEKVVSTNDSSLNLSSIPKSFTEHHITEYNKGNIIKQVEVELEEKQHFEPDKSNRKDVRNGVYYSMQLKLNQQNEIIISEPERDTALTSIEEKIIHKVLDECSDDKRLPSSEETKVLIKYVKSLRNSF